MPGVVHHDWLPLPRITAGVIPHISNTHSHLVYLLNGGVVARQRVTCRHALLVQLQALGCMVGKRDNGGWVNGLVGMYCCRPRTMQAANAALPGQASPQRVNYCLQSSAGGAAAQAAASNRHPPLHHPQHPPASWYSISKKASARLITPSLTALYTLKLSLTTRPSANCKGKCERWGCYPCRRACATAAQPILHIDTQPLAAHHQAAAPPHPLTSTTGSCVAAPRGTQSSRRRCREGWEVMMCLFDGKKSCKCGMKQRHNARLWPVHTKLEPPLHFQTTRASQ